MSNSTVKLLCKNIEKKPGCIQATLEILGDKWTPLLLGQLIDSAKTFGELEVVLVGISPRTLSARLKHLETKEIMLKHQYNAHPPRYRYELSIKGRELQEVLHKMADWGEKYYV